ncbi:MAG: uL30 family ribosomal protein [Candidatus Micrarchaeota archaeon]
MTVIAVVRVRGVKNLRQDIKHSLKQLKLTRKNHCIAVETTKEWFLQTLKKVKDYVTWGEASEGTVKALEKRKAEFSWQEEGFKAGLYRLNNPKGGWKGVKNHFPRGDLGYRKEKINDLIMRMLH